VLVKQKTTPAKIKQHSVGILEQSLNTVRNYCNLTTL